jgi:hypothetical protein
MWSVAMSAVAFARFAMNSIGSRGNCTSRCSARACTSVHTSMTRLG